MLVTVTSAAHAQRLPDSVRSFGPEEREQLKRALSLQGMTEQELEFEKKWATDSFFRLRIVDDLLDHPLHGPDYCDSSAWVVQNLKDNIPALLLFQAQQTDIPIAAGETLALNRELDNEAQKWRGDTIPNCVPVAGAVRLILASYAIGDRFLKQAVRNLSADELQKLLIAAPTMWGDEDDSSEHYLKGELQREFGVKCDTSLKIDTDTMLPILCKLNRKALALSGIAVGLAVNRARQMLTASESLFPREAAGVKAPGTSGDILFYEETEWGKVAIGGRDANRYDGDFCLVIDLGGDDRYAGRIGGGIGILSQPFSVGIDLAGDDVYDSPKKLFNFGAGIFGAGFLVDLGGNDVYRSFHNTQGIGMFGTGVLLDCAGDDFYEAGWYAQGGGMVGSGLLLDAGGDDVYHIFDYGQGFAGVWGYGLQADHSGNDVYYAGGKYIHHPLLPTDYRSFAQGFAIGFRPDCSGGIGFLYDRSGNDFYNAEVFAQATSYWYALGMIYDGAGNDRYAAGQYSQGAGIHLSVGILIDRSGNDQYFSRLGPAQGEGHDLSVGILIDREGDDSYSCTGGQGVGLTNSVGLFIDARGHDNYMTTEKLGQGTGNWARDFGGIGVFIDEDGDNDQYVKTSPGEDNSSWTQGTYGAGVSLKARPKPVIPVEETTYTPDSSQAKRPVKDVFKDAALWEVGEVRNKVKKARKELVALGKEAAEYVAKEKLSTKDGLELRAIEDLAKAMPDTIAPYLFKGLHAGNRYTRSNCAYLIGQAKIKSGVDSLLAALRLAGFRPRWAILAFGEIGDKTVVPRITPYLKDASEPTRITTAATLGKLKDARALPELVAALADPRFTVRSAAEQAIVSIGDTSVSYLLIHCRRNDWSARVMLHVGRLLGMLGAKLDTAERRAERIQVRDWLGGQFLRHSDPAVRAVAVEGLGKMMDPPIRRLLEASMSDEADKFVLGKYRAALKAGD
jgi:HEAT repeat protein